MASTTKIMTAIIAIENSNLSDEVFISKKASNTGGSTLGIRANTKLTMKTLLYGLLIRSGNDCAVAIAEHIAGNVENFAIMMNQKAISLGLENTNFITPHGLDSSNHYTTAYDLALLTNYALNNSIFSSIVNTKNTTLNLNGINKNITNTNELLDFIDGVYGVKTGFTANAGRCLVTSYKKNNLDIIIVVLGADTKKIRSQDTINLINYTNNNYKMIDTKQIIFDNYNPITISFPNSLSKTFAYLDENTNYIYPININNKDYNIKYFIFPNKIAPLNKDSKIGILQFYSNGKLLYEKDLLLLNSIPSFSFNDYIYIILKKIHSNYS